MVLSWGWGIVVLDVQLDDQSVHKPGQLHERHADHERRTHNLVTRQRSSLLTKELYGTLQKKDSINNNPQKVKMLSSSSPWEKPSFGCPRCMSGFAPFRVSPFGCSCSFRTSFPLRLLSCTLGLVLTTSATTVSSDSSVLALLSIGLVVNFPPYRISPFPNPFLSYLALLSYRLSIYSLDDGRTRDSKS
jgi:hypothetical protein